LARFVELRRHTNNDGDVLTDEGVRDAFALGASLSHDYAIAVSSGAQRATQTAACILAAMGRPVPGGVIVEPGIRSSVEDEWRAAASDAGSSDLGALLAAEPGLVVAEAAILAEALKRVFAHLQDGERALVVGHSPTNEAAVFGLTDVKIAPLDKGGGVVVVDTGTGYEVEPAD
jgi:broad specificity phosphatase PhoE